MTRHIIVVENTPAISRHTGEEIRRWLNARKHGRCYAVTVGRQTTAISMSPKMAEPIIDDQEIHGRSMTAAIDNFVRVMERMEVEN